MVSVEMLFFILLSASRLTPAALGFLNPGSDNLIFDSGDGATVISGLQSVSKLMMLQEGDKEKKDVSERSKRAANYEVTDVSARQDGETRIVSWSHATGPIKIAKYNIYRTFTTAIPFDVTQLTQIVSVDSNQPTQWRDACRIEEVSVRYAITAVDITNIEHTSDVVPSPLLPLVGSFVPSTPIRYLLPSLGRCCVLCHDIVYNPDANEFLLVYDCDNDGDGNADDVFATRLDYSGNNIQATRSLKALLAGSATQGCPSAAYNPQSKQYLVAYHIRTQTVNFNKQSIVTRVIPSTDILSASSPRLSVKGTDSKGRAVDLRKTRVIYNPVTYGYVLALELVDQSYVQIITAFLSNSGILKSGTSVFNLGVDVQQPNVIYDPLTEFLLFVSQLDSSHAALPSGQNALINKWIPATGNLSGAERPSAFAYTNATDSSVSLHRVNVTNSFRVCYLVKDAKSFPKLTCTKLPKKDTTLTTTHNDISFCTCKGKVSNPTIIEYPVNGQVFGVWEETDSANHRLHGYYVSTQQFVQDPVSTVQKYPTAVYKSFDGQVCVAWQHHYSDNLCSKLAFRCYKSNETCSDPCCCSSDQIDHCNACGFLTCDSNAECTRTKQCKCRSNLGFSGDGFTCKLTLSPCAANLHTCKATEDCVLNGTSHKCVCKTGYKKVGDSCVNEDPCAHGAHDCNDNAYCQREDDNSYACHCRQGYVGDGKVCIDASVCHKNASLSEDNTCVCSKGFVGNGAFCCRDSIGDKQAAIGNSVTLNFDSSCLGPFKDFARFKWFHGSSETPIVTSGNSHYELQDDDTKLVIINITTKQLGRYTLLIFANTHGPFKVTVRIDLVHQTGKCTCGLSGRKDARIATGGKEAKVGEFPWQAMLCATNGTFCGGVMISRCCILTAAHCVSGSHGRSQFDISNSKSLKVCLGRRCGDCNVGSFKTSKESNEERVQCFKANKIDVHQEYNENSFEHDIAMIQLKGRNCIKCRAASVRPICLPRLSRDSAHIAPGEKATVTGWGEIQTGKGVTGCLRKGRTTLISRGRCSRHFAASTPPHVIANNQMCAADAAGPCQGDSGGPLIVKNPDFENRFVLAGLVSWGIGCGVTNSYGVYVDILHHLDWIYKTCKDWNRDGN